MLFPTDENVLVGLDRADDAGVYRISDDLALIQTVDFFTPVVDDPYWFGQIAAANALSDIYAMGGMPKTAMNLVAFPSDEMDLSVLRGIIQGGIDKLAEARVALVGGHSIQDKEIKYGLSVTGVAHPKDVLAKKTLQPGDRLILTKPLGMGIINRPSKEEIEAERQRRITEMQQQDSLAREAERRAAETLALQQVAEGGAEEEVADRAFGEITAPLPDIGLIAGWSFADGWYTGTTTPRSTIAKHGKRKGVVGRE